MGCCRRILVVGPGDGGCSGPGRRSQGERRRTAANRVEGVFLDAADGDYDLGAEESAGSERIGGPHGGDCGDTVVVVVVVVVVEGFVRLRRRRSCCC